jgi:hypothetical protein
VHGRLRDASEILETWSRLQTPAAVAVINKNDFSRLSKLAHSRVIAKKAYDAFAAGAHEAPRASSRAQFCPNIF